VNVVDDAAALTAHPDLPVSRVAFAHDPTAQGPSQAGHGFLNAHVIGGYNTLTGAAFEDASAYNYGLGICPFVNLGNTKVFSNGSAATFTAAATTRLNAAYAGGARISSNSWGYTSGNSYNADTQSHDNLVRDAQTGTAGNQELMIVFAAGNSGSGANTVASPRRRRTSSASARRRTCARPAPTAAASATPARTARRTSSGSRPRPELGRRRKKPDIMAPGTHIQGAASRSRLGYDGAGVCNQYWPPARRCTLVVGTSHSTPRDLRRVRR
jgi:hypothetical protein